GLGRGPAASTQMTPFGRKLRAMREGRQCQLKDLAKALKVSSAYLSALEHGHRGKPSPGLVQQVAAYFNLAWEQVDELKALAELSDPRITIDTGGLSPEATELANRLAAGIDALSEAQIARLLALLKPPR
ncbi:MAG: helix-turn-helix domain-containing protein, partial [Dongiaceae bacterium]